MFRIVKTPTGRNGMRHAVVRQRVQKFLGARQYAERRRMFGKRFLMDLLNPFRILFGDGSAGFTQQGIEH